MALNEHDPIGPAVNARSTVDEAADGSAALSEQDRLAHQVQEVVLTAERALMAGDVATYVDALGAVDAIDHLQRRHHARVKTVERGMVVRPDATREQTAATILAALRALTGWLEDDPREPTLAGYAGVLCVELGLYREGEDLLLAAAALNPELPDVGSAIRTAQARRAARAEISGLPSVVRAALPRLRDRLRALTPSIRPAEGLRLSLCMIVRDEEEMLPRCLDAVKDGVDEMIIVDTGSQDRTVEIAESYGATVLHFPWTGSFGEARNVGLDAATGDWFLVLDADEVFVGDDARRLRDLLGRTWREAFYVEEINHLGDLDDGVSAKHDALRLYRNRPEYRYAGTVHEQLAHHLPGYLSERLERTELRIDHFGYLGAVRVDRDKSNRNLELLLTQLEEGEDTAFVHFNLGSEYLGTDEEASQRHFARAWELIEPDPNATLYGFTPSLCSRYVRSLRGAERWDDLDAAADVIHGWFPGFTDVWFEQSLAALDRGDQIESRRLVERCLELGDAPAKYSSTVGCGTYLATMRLAQLDALAGDEDRAIERMREVRRDHPTYFGLIDPYVGALLGRGDAASAVLDEFREGDCSPSGWMMVGVNLQERGHLAEAEAAFRAAIERRPTFWAVRVALADLLLVQGRIAEAAAEAERVPVDDPRVGGAAVRTGLFAWLALEPGDATPSSDPAPDAIDAAEVPDAESRRAALVAALDLTDLLPGDQAVLRAWAARRAGDDAPAVDLDLASVDRMTPMLDGLLRLGAGDAFADLAGLLPDTGIDRRTQHEVLATLLLRRGLSELAAEEWVAAVHEHGPDAAAFAGLAEVARLQGLDDDARTLAEEALTLEADQPLATRVLEALPS